MDILDDFEQEFNNSYKLSLKEDLLDKLLQSDLDFSNEDVKESIKEYKAHLVDFKCALEQEEDMLINKEIDERKYTLFTCIKSNEDFMLDNNYHVFIDDVAKSYLESGVDQISEELKEYVSNIKPIYSIILDNGVGTLKHKTTFKGDFSKHFTELVF